MKLLHIDSSILGDHSVSRALTADIVAVEKHRYPDLQVRYIDLCATPLDHLTVASLMASQAPATDAAPTDISFGRDVLEAFIAADIVVIGAPMYNFSIPSQLKAWIDRVTVAGKTFRYTANGSIGLIGGKKAIVASTRGGLYGTGTPLAHLDHQETYLRGALEFMGITDIRFIRAEGLKISPEQSNTAVESAKADIARMRILAQ